MIAFERIIEAVEFANDEGTYWWEEFDSIQEAKSTLKQASRHHADEWEVIQLAEALDTDYPTNSSEKHKILEQCFSTLRQQLRNN